MRRGVEMRVRCASPPLRGRFLYCRDAWLTARAQSGGKGSPRECSRASESGRECVPVGRRNPCNVERLTIRRVGPSLHRGGAKSRTPWRTRRRRRVVPCTLIPYTLSRGQVDRPCCVGEIGGCSWQYLSIEDGISPDMAQVIVSFPWRVGGAMDGEQVIPRGSCPTSSQ